MTDRSRWGTLVWGASVLLLVSGCSTHTSSQGASPSRHAASSPAATTPPISKAGDVTDTCQDEAGDNSWGWDLDTVAISQDADHFTVVFSAAGVRYVSKDAMGLTFSLFLENATDENQATRLEAFLSDSGEYTLRQDNVRFSADEASMSGSDAAKQYTVTFPSSVTERLGTGFKWSAHVVSPGHHDNCPGGSDYDALNDDLISPLSGSL